MYFIKLETLELVTQFTKVCESYKSKMDIDVVHGRYVIDGASILGVTSLLGKIVKIVPNNEDATLCGVLYRKLEEIGAFKEDKMTVL